MIRSKAELTDLLEFGETISLECKRADSKLPNSIWPTYEINNLYQSELSQDQDGTKTGLSWDQVGTKMGPSQESTTIMHDRTYTIGDNGGDAANKPKQVP